MKCDKNMERETVSLALGELAAAGALAAERHLAACPRCAALRLAILAEKAGLQAGSLPLLQAGPDFAAAAVAAAAGERNESKLAFAGLALAAGLAALLIFGVPRATPPAPAPAPSLTPGFLNPAGASVPGGTAATDFLYRLSVRTGSGPAAGPAPSNLKEAV
ncbi:MAG: hypothetical protein A2X35_11380 [Elusimicrobia bacterium GWA2_61_42]|nr:MAG: hypothetical protein A2X35_11380 [Elusimicrobia bacterium GWA2_61_42]OGR75860.1 MAG: hypothetical protein A2X38_07535 [Elusimicrobia bacterium GWC2_61_25]